MSDMRQMTAMGRNIEDGSFAIIDCEAGPHNFDPDQWQVVRRVIHATADFEFKDLMHFHPDAVRAGVGRSLLPCRIAEGIPELSRLSGAKPVLSREMWLIVHPDLRHLARVRAVIAWIEQLMSVRLTQPPTQRQRSRAKP